MRVPPFPGSRPEQGVPDMTVISNIDEHGINKNLNVRYDNDIIYVSGLHILIIVAFNAEVWQFYLENNLNLIVLRSIF